MEKTIKIPWNYHHHRTKLISEQRFNYETYYKYCLLDYAKIHYKDGNNKNKSPENLFVLINQTNNEYTKKLEKLAKSESYSEMEIVVNSMHSSNSFTLIHRT